MAYTKEQIVEHLNKALIELFEIEPERLVPQAKLYEDLDVDSIDTIDLLIELKALINADIDAKTFSDAVTIDDVATIIHNIQ